ncbi:MAG: hypothetical protein PVJ53_16865 [Desulfobacterales bacterium]|jgi:tRNA G46 methylase TrmB
MIFSRDSGFAGKFKSRKQDHWFISPESMSEWCQKIKAKAGLVVRTDHSLVVAKARLDSMRRPFSEVDAPAESRPHQEA